MDVEIFKAIKGKKEDAPELKIYIDSLGEIPLIEDFDGGRRYYSFPKTGMNLVFDDSILKSIQLFSANVEENTDCYQGQLPHGLILLDSKDNVLKKNWKP